MITTNLCSVPFRPSLAVSRLKSCGKMKLRNGNSVEALRRECDPRGSWFPGTIISKCCNYYIVKYKFLMDQNGEPLLEKVHVEDVRPQPLHAIGKRWMVGDIAEVFDSKCWRVGKIAEVLQRNWFVVRLFGSIQLKEFHESKIRNRLTWHNNEWSAMGQIAPDKQFAAQKDSISSSDLFSKAPSQQTGKDCDSRDKDCQKFYTNVRNHCQQYNPVRTINRSHGYNRKIISNDVVIGGSCKKRKLHFCAGEFKGPLMGALPSFKQVDDIPSLRVRLDEKFITESTEMDAKMGIATTDWLHVSSTRHWSDQDGDQCSVASCSSDDFAYYTEENFLRSLENISSNSDAESSFPMPGKKHIFPLLRHKLDVDIHELELHAYKSTMQALYAAGPLSWEQESLLTNLRLSLNISDEEHLLQLRHLLSA